MNDEQVLCLVIDYLEECHIEYMVTGSLASNVHGLPRTTNDADVVIETDAAKLSMLILKLKDEFYISREAAEDALRRRSMFNAIHLETGFKIDIITCKLRSFSREEFKRRQQVQLDSRPAWFASAEDVILSKLEWAKAGESERQFNDALNVARVQAARLDYDYLKEWAEALDIAEELNRLTSELDRSDPPEK